MPITPGSVIDRGDVLQLVGSKPDVERAARELGYADRPTTSTNMVFVGTGIVLGGFVGLLSVTIGNIPLTLTASGGALVMGLVFGWLRSVYPFFGRIPEPAICSMSPLQAACSQPRSRSSTVSPVSVGHRFLAARIASNIATI